MRRGALWQISIATTAEAEEAVADLLCRRFGRPASTHTDFESGLTTVSVYCEARPTNWPEQRATLGEGLRQISCCGLAIGMGKVSIRKIPRENWAESWKRHFKPLAIGDALLIKPSWSRRRPRRGQALVVLDPGLSFGTGHHPTTKFCLRQLTVERQAGKTQSFLDIGTGSGILAIAAIKQGYRPVHAFDFDAAAVRVARENAQLNQVTAHARITRRDVTKLPFQATHRYDVVGANLISTLLITERQRIAARVKVTGLLVLAGILKSEFEAVRTVYEQLGFRLVASKAGREWHSGAFRATAYFNSRKET
ncbi:MAG: 50S ribosomal protein L11 methyltransferase [Verrucomicrobiae bacterium]|nr:50S ribosomal protein L11 methyltransferase [Verrucomicrobiae bacterium]